MKFKEFFKDTKDKNVVDAGDMFSKKTISIKIQYKTILKIVVLVVVLIIGIIIGFKMNDTKVQEDDTTSPPINPEPYIDVTYLNTALKEASELTTAKLKINGLVHYHDKGALLFNRSDFLMKYTAEIGAGIEMSKIKIVEEDVDHERKVIVVKIPAATVFKPNVYHGDKYIKFYDEKISLFNPDAKEDLSRALALAEMDAEKEAVNSGLLELANKQSETLIKGILSDAVSLTASGYTIEIQRLDEEN